MRTDPKTFVLIHGSWLGGWSWRRVEPLLRAREHRVFAPTMTGVGERSHLISRNITLDTWVQDVEQLFEFEELERVILVGHSFGGRVVTGFADRRPDLIERIVFLDSALPVSGLSLLDQLPAAARAARVASSASSGGISIPPPTALALGVMEPKDQAWVDRRMTPQPFETNAVPLNFANQIGNGRPVSFVEFTEPVFPASELAVRFARQQTGWDIHTIATGHMAMVSEPDALADLLCTIAETPLKASK
jgi:pimeloyl-ACP methyl ester carboxylesterase